MEDKERFEYPVIDAKRTGSCLRFICKNKNLTVKDIQKHLHIASNQAIYDWFSGKTLPSLNNMYALSRLINLPMDRLIINEKQYFCFNDLHIQSVGNTRNRLLEYAKRIQAYAA